MVGSGDVGAMLRGSFVCVCGFAVNEVDCVSQKHVRVVSLELDVERRCDSNEVDTRVYGFWRLVCAVYDRIVQRGRRSKGEGVRQPRSGGDVCRLFGSIGGSCCQQVAFNVVMMNRKKDEMRESKMIQLHTATFAFRL